VALFSLLGAVQVQDKENVSIIIATHNNVSTIERAVRSAICGDRPANRIVIGDNDSTDGTYERLCKILEAKEVTVDGQTGLPPEFDGELDGTPVTIFRKRKSTTGHTLNIAMQARWQGVTIFGFMEPTSWYAQDKIAQAIRAFDQFQAAACVVSDCDDHHTDRGCSKKRIERVFRQSFDAQRLLMGHQYDRNFLVRASSFPKLKSGFNEELLAMEDYELLLRLSEIGLIYHIPAPLHSNTVTQLDEASSNLIAQCEDKAKQIAMQRREE